MKLKREHFCETRAEKKYTRKSRKKTFEVIKIIYNVFTPCIYLVTFLIIQMFNAVWNCIGIELTSYTRGSQSLVSAYCC